MQVAARPDAALPTPLSDDEFAASMAPFAPFEHRPAVAVAVSGGRDSLCLALLASRWAARQGGDLVALTVDHGLRTDSAAESRQVGDWLRRHGIRHHILRWSGPYPTSGIQAAARQARYRLLADHCVAQGILHLLVGHHRDDQGETVLIRHESSSGRDGLAAMAAVNEQNNLRLLRPLLDMPRERLAATLTALGQSWIDDPSNENPAMARGRLRSSDVATSLSEAAVSANNSADARVLAEGETACLAARALRFHPAGFITIDRAVLAAGTPEIIERVLARAVMAVAGRSYPPRSVRTKRLAQIIAGGEVFSGHTLAGCRLVGHENAIHVCREAARIGPPVELMAGTTTVWDNRFRVSVTKSLGRDAKLAALTAKGWKQIVRVDPQLRNIPIPYAARTVLPALWSGEVVSNVPH
ncbi:MAG: tRNA lysidine(34) synthetase TilS, partial [Alphaproteobacteria bacterium]|nr:tRNA lysidine(34) synthetase TilS [Alphaproteobacteria bacterium]